MTQTGAVGVSTSVPMQGWRVPICTEQTAEELAYHCHRAAVIEDEGRQAGRLIDASTDPQPRQSDDRLGQLHGQCDRPLPLVVARASRTLTRQQLDVIEDSLPIERLTDVHPTLAEHAD